MPSLHLQWQETCTRRRIPRRGGTPGAPVSKLVTHPPAPIMLSALKDGCVQGRPTLGASPSSKQKRAHTLHSIGPKFQSGGPDRLGDQHGPGGRRRRQLRHRCSAAARVHGTGRRGPSGRGCLHIPPARHAAAGSAWRVLQPVPAAAGRRPLWGGARRILAAPCRIWWRTWGRALLQRAATERQVGVSATPC
jgi:hypothetical protein